MYSIAQLKVGTAIQVEGHPYIVTSSQFSKQARGGGVMKTTVKSLLTGNSLPMTFQGNEKIEPAEITYTKAQFLYSQDEEYFFMDNATYEQFSFKKDELGDKIYFLLDGMEVNIQRFEDQPINVQVPPKVNLKVVGAEPSTKGDTAQGRVTKPITLETGLVVQAPIFIEVGEMIRVNTETGEYSERV
jgi:elongation factor P